jgi:glycosyltransferase involved in cell wall biosynthesis
MSTTLEVVIPVLNEENRLPPSLETLHQFLTDNLDSVDWRILIADNGSTDSTLKICQEFAERFPRVGYTRLNKRGRGRALSKAWLESEADVVSYMDVDLSTDLAFFPDLVESITSGECDLAIGSRLSSGSNVIGRSPKREFYSRAYSATFRTMFFTSFKDAQCGFKALSRKAVNDLVPLVKDTGWFFDTELLLLAERNGFRIKELPVKWTDDPDSRVDVIKTSYLDMKGLLRLRFGGRPRV